jgi:hypothetical protein
MKNDKLITVLLHLPVLILVRDNHRRPYYVEQYNNQHGTPINKKAGAAGGRCGESLADSEITERSPVDPPSLRRWRSVLEFVFVRVVGKAFLTFSLVRGRR